MTLRAAPLSLGTLIVAFIFALLVPFQTAALAADKSGKFSGMGRYSVKGTAQVSRSGGKTTVTLSSDFKSSSGPDLYIYVGNGSPTKRIAKLKSFRGGQSYTFSGTDKITSVHVYCKRFSVGFGTAKVK
ncbi:MAG: DM13 domain-containing protein [Rhizobiaceae bacterium]